MTAIRLLSPSGLPIEISQDVLVGRDPSCDVVLTDGSVSRRHARIERRDSDWAVIDQGSANGTFIDGQRTSEAVIRQGQHLRFGALEYRVEIAAESSEATILHPAPSTRPAPPPPPPVHAGVMRSTSTTPPEKPLTPRKSKSPLFWITTGGCGCLTIVALLLVAIVAIPFGFAFIGTRDAIHAVETQLTDIRNGKLASVYDRLSADYKSRLGPEEFEFYVESHSILSEYASISFSGRSRQNDEVKLQGKLTSASGRQAPIAVFLVKESGTWRIKDISLE